MKFFTGLIIPVFLFALIGAALPEPAEAHDHASQELTTSASEAAKTCDSQGNACDRADDGTCAYPDGACCKSVQVASVETEAHCENCQCEADCASGDCAEACDGCESCDGCSHADGHVCTEYRNHAKGLTSKHQSAKAAAPAKEAAVEVLIGAGAQATARAAAIGVEH